VLGTGYAITLRGPIQRGESSERDGRPEGRVVCVEEHLVPHGEAHVPPVRVELLLAPVLLLLQQRAHLARHPRHQVGSPTQPRRRHPPPPPRPAVLVVSQSA
jgi:hypothetical protein